MKKIKILSAAIFTSVLIVLSSCFDDPGTDILLKDTYVEISEATTSTGLDVGKSYDRLNDGVPKKDSIRINLVGPQRSTAVTVNYSIDDASTAVAGVHYNLISGSSVQIPANSSFGYIYFEVISDNIEPGEVWKLKVNLTGVDAGITISENYKTFTRSIRIKCPFDRTNFLGLFNANEPGYGNYDVNFTADPDDANAIVNDNFWDFSGVVKYVFDPLTNKVSLPTQDVVMGGVTYVVAQGAGSSTYDACEHSFIVVYTVRRKSDNALFDSNTHTFTQK